MKALCTCRTGEWSGSPAHRKGVEGWTCDDCNRFIPCELPPLAPSTVDVCWIDDNNGAGPQKLSNAIRCF